MADPLSVAASIIGIIAAAGKVAETLGPFISTVKDTTKSAAAIFAEVSSSKIILSALQVLLDDIDSAPRKRRELIQVSQLLTTLTDGALIFSELEPLVLQLGTSTEKWSTRIQWARKKDTLDVFTTRLQLFKSSISVMLNILQCDSDIEAARSRAELHVLTSNLVTSNLAISSRLSLLERSPQWRVNSVSISDQASHRSSTATIQSQIRLFGFEPDLERSWVYRKARRSTSDVSRRSSVALSHAWSALTDISLSDISVISVVALPISSSDLLNGHHYQNGTSQLVPSSQHRNRHQSGQITIGVPIATNALSHGIFNRAGTASASRSPSSIAIETTSRLEIGSPTLINASVFGYQPPEGAKTTSKNGAKYVQLTKKEMTIGSPTFVKTTVPESLKLISLQPIGVTSSLPRSPLSAVRSYAPTVVKHFTREYKIVMLGHEDVEKFKIALMFVQPYYMQEIEVDMIDLYQRDCMVDDAMALIEVICTAAQKEYAAMREQSMRDGHGFMLLYNTASRASFLQIRTFKEQMLRYKDLGPLGQVGAFFPMILIGVDCEREDMRDVSAAEGYAMGCELGCKFLELSYDTGQSVDRAYFDLVREIRAYDEHHSSISVQ